MREGPGVVEEGSGTRPRARRFQCSDVRKDFSAPKMPFVIGVLGGGGVNAKDSTASLREAMTAPSLMPEFKATSSPCPRAVLGRGAWAIDEKHGKVKAMAATLKSKGKNGPNKNGTMTDAQQKEYLKKYEADLISPVEAELWKRDASNAGYQYLGCAKTFALMGKAFAEATPSMMKTTLPTLALAAILAAACPALAAPKGNATAMPDFTKGARLAKDSPHDWTLGPTGARGWIFTANGHSADARQILVTAVAKGSPAEPVLAKDDVILGVDGKNFSGDARIQFANAIAAAEMENGGGKLRLLRWRAGKSEETVVTLPVLGSYSATAPYDCPKSKRIFELGCKSLAQRIGGPNYTRSLNPIPRSLNALALLASGNNEYLPLLQKEARWAADYSADSFATWHYGYVLVLLAEYVIATGDQAVMPGLKRLALESAHGQSGVGTWGHKFARPDGNLNGYGCMNQPGLSLTIGMALARDAGVKEPELDRAIAKAAGFVRWYVNKGAVPYGDHQPFPAHEDNGKCSSAAVLYDLLGDREAAEFFAKMSTAAYSERERGHTGNFFNVLWALPGVARIGPLATGAYLKEQAWHYDLARGWDTSFVYQGSPVGEEEHGSYKGWDCTGGYLLAYALPLNSLRLTGKRAFSVPALNAAQVDAVIAAGRDFPYKNAENPYDRRTPVQLLAGLSSWSPSVRLRSATALGKKPGNFLPDVLKLLASDNRDARYGACEALGALGPRADAAAAQLRALLKDPDP